MSEGEDTGLQGSMAKKASQRETSGSSTEQEEKRINHSRHPDGGYKTGLAENKATCSDCLLLVTLIAQTKRDILRKI